MSDDRKRPDSEAQQDAQDTMQGDVQGMRGYDTTYSGGSAAMPARDGGAGDAPQNVDPAMSSEHGGKDEPPER